MLYCETCQLMAPPGATECPCGGGLRPVRENDPVLLLALGGPKIDLVTPLLEDSGIPFSREGNLGAGFTARAGALLETYRVFVPYGAYRQAHDLIAQTFGEDAEIMDSLIHFRP